MAALGHAVAALGGAVASGCSPGGCGCSPGGCGCNPHAVANRWTTKSDSIKLSPTGYSTLPRHLLLYTATLSRYLLLYTATLSRYLLLYTAPSQLEALPPTCQVAHCPLLTCGH